MMGETDWQKEYLESIKASVERLEDKIDGRIVNCEARFRSLEQSKTKQAGFVAGVCLCVVAAFKAITMMAKMFQ